MIKQIKKQIIYATCTIVTLSTLLLTASFASPKQEKSIKNQQTQNFMFVDQSKLIAKTLFGKRFINEMESLNIQLTSEVSELERRSERLQKELGEQNELLKAFSDVTTDAYKGIQSNVTGIKSEISEIQMTFRERQSVYQEAAKSFEQRVSAIFKDVVDRAVKNYSEANQTSAIILTQATLYISPSNDITDELIMLIDQENNGENISSFIPNVSFSNSEAQNTTNGFENNFG
jgi:Skp family chaperone for outer membrane proteins